MRCDDMLANRYPTEFVLDRHERTARLPDDSRDSHPQPNKGHDATEVDRFAASLSDEVVR